MSEYIIRETGFPGAVKQEVIGELVRCKDCRHRKKPECPMCDYIRQDDGVHFRVIDRAKDDGFCDEGERREDE